MRWTDLQKHNARECNGKLNIWGKPAKVIRYLIFIIEIINKNFNKTVIISNQRVSYNESNGKPKHTILLISGFWGIARHINYFFLLLIETLICCPALTYNPIPYSYLIFLIPFLIHRTIRDNNKCHEKYGNQWEEYCRRVPYKLIPGLY